MGWMLEKEDGNELMRIDWMSGKPAPEAVIEFLHCDCKRICKKPDCSCLENGIKCTNMCKLKTCENQVEEEEDTGQWEDDEDAEDAEDEYEDN